MIKYFNDMKRISNVLFLISFFTLQIVSQPYVKRLESWVPIRSITSHELGYFWFGYYDKMEVSPDGRFVLGMRTKFQDRSPGATDTIDVGMIDLDDNDRWIKFGESTAWNWQQGCMLQWIPNSNGEVIWNDRDEEGFVARIYNVHTGELRTLQHPVYALSPDGKEAVYTDFRRIQDMRPGYGYPGFEDPASSKLSPKESGVWKLNLKTGKSKHILSIDEIARLESPNYQYAENKHYFNHLLYNSSGDRIVLLHRWRTEHSLTNPDTPFGTRMVTADLNGKNIVVVDDYGHTSHFIWKDDKSILAWARQSSHGDRFYLFRDGSSNDSEVVGPDVMIRNGHCTYLPDKDWILNDTYPDENRLQEIYLYHVPSGEKYTLAKVFLPFRYKFDSELRIDTHPRISPDGNFIIIDSAHEGYGRQLYLIDISSIINM
jgi:hypothetical protein